uniref:F-box DNA helicase 1 n=1 Tax=Pundamilia nyererei TaxID=303518 RepID=A0A3B4GBP1_9CICH
MNFFLWRESSAPVPAVMMPEPEAGEEEEIDDASLLAVEMMPQSKVKEEQQVDYLEGMTAEMFGNDDEFDQCDIDNEEEEVEALPDAHFGLLGSRSGLLKPQGCMDDLPEEVLREVLCLLPAQDLYLNVRLVCHRWRNIVQDSTFVPFKKQYYRYMMRERHTEMEICSILRNSGITGPASSEHSIRKLVVLMAQHKVGERLRPDDVLERVKKHRLFPQAECVHNGSDFQGPNPYAAMAVILILSEGVGDVQALVSLLTGCMSHSAITEYLCHMAMMLLALERNKVTVSNRLHYNIYYVLHLMENVLALFLFVSGVSARRPQIHLTQEQQQILSHNIQDDHVVKIIAFAGTGKTTTLVKYAEQRPDLRFLYVAFNNSVASEARRRFPRNVDCKTVHSLAYNDVGKRYKFRDKLTFNMKAFAISSVLPKGRGGFTKAKVVMTTLNAFMASTDETITIRHVPNSRVTKNNFRKDIDHDEKLLVVRDAQRIWKKMKDLNEKSKDAYYMTHDGYLKLWQLQDPKPCLSGAYNALFIDEAQDCTPAIMDVLLSQSCGKILVGDPHQQIYTFRGAVNALNVVEHTHIYYLTQSFRFGAEIAYVGATILKVCKGVKKILVGGNQKGGVCDNAADRVTAILSRCNFGVFSEAVRLTDANPSCRLHFIGVTGTSFLLSLFFLSRLDDFNCLEDGVFLLMSVVFPLCVLALLPDFIVGTVHKSKGLEFDTVMVTDDFVKVPCSKHNLRHSPEFSFAKIPDDEWNLLYVAVTRAKTTLIITENIRRIITMAGVRNSHCASHFLSYCCAVSVTPFFDTDGLSQGGPLCEKCVWTRVGPIAFLMTEDVLSMAEIPQRLDLPVHHAFFLELFF